MKYLESQINSHCNNRLHCILVFVLVALALLFFGCAPSHEQEVVAFGHVVTLSPIDQQLINACHETPTSIEQIAPLLEAGANINVRDSSRWTPLMYAASKNANPNVIEFLLDAGADINATSAGVSTLGGVTPLLIALTDYNNADVISLLIDRGADVNVVANETDSVMILASLYMNDVKLISTLIDAGASINVKGSFGETPLHNAVMYITNLDVISLLIPEGNDINAVDSDGMTLLMLAAKENSNPNVLHFLLNLGADINVRDHDGLTAYNHAAQNKSIKGSVLLRLSNNDSH